MQLKFSLFAASFLLVFSLQGHTQIPIGLLNNAHKFVKLKKALKETRTDGTAKISLDSKEQLEIPASHKLQIQQVSDNVATLKDMSDGTIHYASEADLFSAKQTITFSAIGGAFTFPFKYRPQNGVLEPSLSLSGVAGIQCSLDKNNDASLSFLLGFGPSSINVNNTNSADTNTANSTHSAATLSFTILGQWNNVQLAISTGIDNNLNNSTDKWIYQSKPWLSLGIGFNIFTSNKN
jgi:hypothetical protein